METNNITFEKVWADDTLMEIKIIAISKFSISHQMCYIDENSIKKMIDKIRLYLADHSQNVYIEFGEKEGNYTPAFSFELKRADVRGHVKIEVDIEIDDIVDRSHRCKYFVESELGAIERFSQKALNFYESEIGTIISLF